MQIRDLQSSPPGEHSKAQFQPFHYKFPAVNFPKSNLSTTPHYRGTLSQVTVLGVPKTTLRLDNSQQEGLTGFREAVILMVMVYYMKGYRSAQGKGA